MASDSLPKDNLLASTPNQQTGSERNCKRFLNSPAKEIDLLSPIKADSARFDLFENLNALDNRESYLLEFSRRYRILVGVSRKLRFTELSNLIDVKDNTRDNDSGVGSETDSLNGDDHTTNGLTSLSTDENCNIINSKYDSSLLSDNSNANDNKVKNSKSEDKAFEVLDNRRVTSSLNATKTRNVISSFDILSQLHEMNCWGVVSLILSHLSDEDLRKVCSVSTEWRDIVIDDKAANTRKIAYIKERRRIATGPEKENSFHAKSPTQRSHTPVLLKVINSETEVPEQPLTSIQTVERFDSFIQEAGNLSNEEKLTKCPKCLYPSKSESGSKFVCTRNLCRHMFCKKCMGPYFDNHSCSVPKLNATLPTFIVGSKQSRRNLRRL